MPRFIDLPKSQNIQTPAARLNLGLDSFVFIDDNPVECVTQGDSDIDRPW